MKTVYLETSIVSYLTGRISSNLVAAAHQQLTREWWELHRRRFEIVISPLVESEASRGDADAAARRVEALEGLPSLAMVPQVLELAGRLMERGALPAKAEDDAMHVAFAAVHGASYLLTWNCRHIDNAETKPIMRFVCEEAGYVCPEICTPEELMGDGNEG